MLITTYLVLNAAMFLLGVFCFMQVRGFLNRNSSITGPSQLEDFKRMARGNMYGALVYIALAIPSVLLTIYITMTDRLYGFVIAMAVSAPAFFFGKYSKKFEQRSRNMECAGPYADEHKRVGQAWVKNLLPDF
jgi:hypothetical protein